MKILSAIFLIFLIGFISAEIKINEVEINPAGKDTGTEWIEFYSDEEIDFSDFKIKNNDGDELLLDFTFSNYYLYNLSKQWLDNSDEKVFLYQGENLIDETDIFEDNQDNEKTWSLCGNNWEFLDSTKNKRNNCEESSKNYDDDKKETEKNNSSKTENISVQNIQTQVQTPIEKQEIKLTTQSIKTLEGTENLKKNYAIYGLILFSLLLAGLFFFKLKKQRFEKNEFR